jgi:hypothetical protein
MAEYQKNNIIFRIASSDAISKFKSKQADALLQLTRKDLHFLGAPKESVLLEYDMLSHWIYKVERICLVAGHGQATKQMKDALVNSFKDECRSMQGIMESHMDTFDATIIKFTKIIHGYSIGMFVQLCEVQLATANNTVAFISICSFISDYLEHFLVSMHELTGNLKSKLKTATRLPALSGTDFCAALEIDTSAEPSLLRAKFFRDLGCGSMYEFKNYSSKDLFDFTQDHLAKQDINLFPEINLPNKVNSDK